jgi:hypothetical protein
MIHAVNNNKSRWGLTAALGAILGQITSNAAKFSSKARDNWQQHIVAALTEYWNLRERGWIEQAP